MCIEVEKRVEEEDYGNGGEMKWEEVEVEKRVEEDEAGRGRRSG